LGFVHRRLSILDLSELGWQPMASSDKRYYLIYNGEVYNYIELRQELERLGHSFISRSDTEVMLAALQQWGVDEACKRFEGMFAFALLDTTASMLTLARDPFGIKPLYYADREGEFAFASEIKALLTLGLPRQANPAAMLAYLIDGVCDHGEETIFRGVRQLPAGGILEVDVAGPPRIVARRVYWSVQLGKTLDVSPAEASRLVHDAFFANIARHLRSDVPVGAALSGGIDSSSIVTSIRRVAPSDLELHAFSYLADDPRLNEEQWMRAAASASRATVHEVHLQATSLVRDVDALIMSQDEPFGGTSIYAQYNIFRAADAAGVRVMLDGQGADELLGGYAAFLGPHVASLARRGHLRAAARLLRSCHERSDASARGIARYVAAAAIPQPLKTLFGARVHSARVPEWIDDGWFADRGVASAVPRRDPGPNLRAHLVRSIETNLRALLRYEDRNSMAFSVESRVPFLTTGFAELVLSLPDEYLIAPDGTRKAVLRNAMRGIVPDIVLDRRDKIGFQTPEGGLIAAAGGWAARVLASDAARGIGGIRRSSIDRAAESIEAGTPDRSIPLWRWLNLIRWADLFQVELS
jgi:asparagine synthase (glutamine-hydrolysing)